MDDRPTVEEVLEQQRALYPEQALTSTMQQPLGADEAATINSGGDVVDVGPDDVEIEGPNLA